MGELSWSLLVQLGLFGGADWRRHPRACSGAVVGRNHLIKSVGCSGGALRQVEEMVWTPSVSNSCFILASV